MNSNEATADKSISDNRLCLHLSLNQDVSQDNRPIVTPMASRSIQWPFADHKLKLKRSTSVDSVLLADSYQLVGAGLALATHNYRHRTNQSTQTPHEWEELDKARGESVMTRAHKYQSTEAKSQEFCNDQGISTNRDQSTQIYDCDYRDDKQTLIPSDISPIKSTKSCPIAIPTKLCVDTSRTANSVEELNQEIESLVLKGIGGNRDQPLCDKIPEGHRAPVFELLTVVANGRHINPRNGSSGGQSGEDSSDLSQPESPLFIETVSTAETNGIDDCSSPKMNKFLTREPPDGCEKIKIMTEDDRANMMNGYADVVRPVQPSSGFVLLPSRSSAFLPILKANDLMADCIHNRINYRKS